jgi:hypothetical protein
MDTYTLGNFDVLHQHGHLLLGNKALERLPRLARNRRLDDRLGAFPKDSRSEWEQILHESRLAGKLNIDRAVAQASKPSPLDVDLVTFHGSHGVSKTHKLHVRILSLAADPLHDDVNRLLVVIEDFRIAPEESNDFCASRTERDLENEYSD